MAVSLFAAAPSDEIVVDHTSSKGAVVRSVRGTLLAMSITRLKETGHYERYLAELPTASSDAILYAVPMSWVPVELMLLHCHACDRLNLPHEILMQLGAQTASTARVPRTSTSSSEAIRSRPHATSRPAPRAYRSLAELFSSKAYVRAVRPRLANPNTFAFVVSWV